MRELSVRNAVNEKGADAEVSRAGSGDRITSAFSADDLASTQQPIEQARWLPARAYVDTDIHIAELEKVFGNEWSMIGHEAQFPSIGDYQTLEFGGKPLILVRDDTGTIRCFLNICRHRGMAVVEGKGNCSIFRCPYHTWAYGLNGKLKAAPLMPSAIMSEGITLSEIQVGNWHGLLFITFTGDPEPLGKGMETVATEMAPWLRDDLEVLYELPFSCDWNWKLMYENGSEPYHVLGTHFNSINAIIPADMSYVTVGEGPYAILHTPYVNTTSPYGDSGDTAIDPVPNLPDWALKEGRFYLMWPAGMISNSAEAMTILYVIPDRVDHHWFVWMALVPKGAKDHPNYAAYREQQIAFAQLIQDEDEEYCARIQKSFAGSTDGYIPGPYNKLEAGIWWFHQWYLDRMKPAAA